MMDDRGVSEITGYAVIAGVIMLAVVGLSSSGMAPLTASTEHIKLEGACNSISSMADLADMICATNNTYPTTYELCAPDGYELTIRDSREDVRSISIYAGNVKLMSTRTGSVGIDSAFRSATYEGGAVFRNDSGLVSAFIKPHVYVNTLPSGRTALYISIIEVRADDITPVRGGPVTLGLKCISSGVSEYHPATPFQTNITVRSVDLKGWEDSLSLPGFTTAYMNGDLVASTWSVQDIYVSNTTLYVKRL